MSLWSSEALIKLSYLIIFEIGGLTFKHPVRERGVKNNGRHNHDDTRKNEAQGFVGTGRLPDIDIAGHQVGVKAVTQPLESQKENRNKV